MRSGQGSAVGHVVLQQRCSGQLNLTCAVPVFVCAQQIDSLSSLLPCGKYEVSIIVPLFFSVTVPGGCHSQGCQGYRTCRLLYSVAPPSYQASSPSSSIVKMSLNDCLKGLCHGSSVHFASFCQLLALNRYET